MQPTGGFVRLSQGAWLFPMPPTRPRTTLACFPVTPQMRPPLKLREVLLLVRPYVVGDRLSLSSSRLASILMSKSATYVVRNARYISQYSASPPGPY
jgi:hypothetical protein